jgi:hypothetical protein
MLETYVHACDESYSKQLGTFRMSRCKELCVVWYRLQLSNLVSFKAITGILQAESVLQFFCLQSEPLDKEIGTHIKTFPVIFQNGILLF